MEYIYLCNQFKADYKRVQATYHNTKKMFSAFSDK